MKPSRALYVALGAAIVGASNGDFPGDGAFSLFAAIILCIGAIVFDWNNA